MSIGIYKIRNKINNKVYIGQSRNIERRFREHSLLTGPRVTRPYYIDLKKYGVMNFEFSILEECRIGNLNAREEYYIKLYNTYEDGYNLTLGGTRKGYSISLTTKDIIEIMDLLKNSEVRQTELAKRFKVDQTNISNINTGSIWINEDEDYPLRKVDLNKTKESIERRTCPICGNSKTRNATLCLRCRRLEDRTVERPQPLELARLVSKNGFTRVGKMYGVSAVAIKKWCKQYSIPHLKVELKEWVNSNTAD